jgi:TPP-dependent 2-oxoacid decarboxylase
MSTEMLIFLLVFFNYKKVAVMPSGKGLVPEHHQQFIGTYWGAISTSFCGELVESADAYLFAGPIFNDYSTVGYSLLIKKEKAIIVQPNRVTIGMILCHLISWYIPKLVVSKFLDIPNRYSRYLDVNV